MYRIDIHRLLFLSKQKFHQVFQKKRTQLILKKELFSHNFQKKNIQRVIYLIPKLSKENIAFNTASQLLCDI